MTKNLTGMTRLTAYLLDLDADMTVSRLNIFLLCIGKENVLVRELCKKTGLGQSTVARTVALLSDKPLRGQKEGINWLRTDPDPEDPRRVVINVTPKGQKVADTILSMLD